MIAFFCWCAGSERHASAMTTALSPLSTMLIMMICSSAIQNSGVVTTAMLSPGNERTRGGERLRRRELRQRRCRLLVAPLSAALQGPGGGAFGRREVNGEGVARAVLVVLHGDARPVQRG